ncbi:Putative alcohol dehydrogenase, zinc-type, GroES-like superfamily, NAD(P)-binding domain superfamily [Septoria linicola]|uniref:Alcohol dehydrogenase, zinc-type, GroES-like superfamily, NAD(P)-binding domain superfamily n=1 Tax=Septoria linicola TaxID=215465 RepID=A0A9Q9ANL0_9PEZI|nr:putative alcohol dehydrogenase, zinc-type, GroES-like superfamily, NAD(P)-binding domain superfamily [Septoria linicola]USW48026.1 Putative alcohol dehydrogenase, zinc-type, GroES-like superfamily, NAD(P)-binding domain superfamily [Septoria linicola]
MANTMKALHYDGPFKVSVRDIERPKIQHPDDVIVKVTTSCICGSDLHMYEGRTAAEKGLVFGHENMGIVTEVGSGVTLLKKGNRVVMPFNVADGRCRNCEEGKTAFCTGVNPGFAGGAYGYVAMGPYSGGQAQYLRVPYADFNALLLPDGTEHEADFSLLADIFPTGWHGLVLAGFKSGESVAVFGAGPVGLMAAYSGVIRGASQVYVVDQVKERLDAAAKIGCIPINFRDSDPVEQIIQKNGGMVDRAVDAVGYQAVDKDGSKEKPNIVLDQLIMVTRPTGGLGIPGLYVPSDPGAPDEQSGKGQILLSFGKLFEKGLSLGTGQCNVKAYNRYLRDLIISGRAKPSFVVSHELGLDDAPMAYDKFDKRIDGFSKVLLHPNGPLPVSAE